jgi:hypothetical protein
MSPRWLSGGVLFALLFGPFAWAQQPGETPLQKVERALDEDTTLEFVDTPLKDVLAFLADQHDVKFESAPEILKGPGKIDPNTPVTRNLKQISLRSALHMLLDEHNVEVTTTAEGKLRLIPSTPELRAARKESKQQLKKRRKIAIILQEVSAAEFVDCPLTDVLAFMADQHDCTIVLSHRAMAAGILPDRPVTLAVKDRSCEEVLKLVLAPMDLEAVIQDEVLLVVPRDPKVKPKASPAVAKALATKLDLNLTAHLAGIAAELSDKTGVPFVLHTQSLKTAKIDTAEFHIVKNQLATPAEILQGLKTATPLTLVERDGMVLISAEPRK